MIRRAMSAAFIQHWQLTARPAELAFNALNQLAAVAAFAWLARQSGRSDIVASVAFGVVFLVVWRATVFQMGGLVNGAHSQGTLELEMMSPAPLMSVMLGKTLAAVAFYGSIGIGGFGLVLLITGSGLTIDRPAVLVGSLAVSGVAVVSTAFLFAPLAFVLGGRGGFFNAIIPIGMLLSGFVQPTGLLPVVVQAPARLLATSWAMDALSLTLRGDPFGQLALRWAASLGLSLATCGVTAWLFVRAERRVRGIGEG